MVNFKKIENKSIFHSDFKPFVKNNKIEFHKNMAIIYGPNGTGKTSLTNVLSSEEGTVIEFEYDNKTLDFGTDTFHIINDQNNRNIIQGKAKDFLLGDNIQREFDLRDFITKERKKIIDSISTELKSEHGISAMSSPLIELISIPEIAELVKDIANNRSKGEKITDEVLIATLVSISVIRPENIDDAKINFLKNDFSKKDSLIKKIENINANPLSSVPRIYEVEENTEAINILNRFQKDQCVVCDTEDINWKALVEQKNNNRAIVIETLSDEVKLLLEKIIELVPTADPFNVKQTLISAISKGDNADIILLLDEVRIYKDIYCQLVLDGLSTLISESELPAKLTEHQKLIAEKREVSDEDMMYVQEIIRNSMGKELDLSRDDSKNLIICLQNQEFLGKERDKLPLSTGEQNFLSLTFEFLKAKNSSCPIVVIDDPISSFDSIYKNKVAYAIIKMLEKKKRIVLTHNLDLLRLLEHQFSGCYKLYLLNNADGGENGFIELKTREQKMLINLEELLSTFRNEIFEHIIEKELFLISMIPFMRGYASIVNKKEIYDKLTHLMHGYKTKKVDISEIYSELFESDGGVLPNSYELSVSDILNKTVDGKQIVNRSQYPLLNKTLQHSFSYLFLRLILEKALVEKFGIDTTANKQLKLGEIIDIAFPNSADETGSRHRMRLMSKKTLINEFNHFEGNLSIFQPAIDITDKALGDERNYIVNFVNNL